MRHLSTWNALMMVMVLTLPLAPHLKHLRNGWRVEMTTDTSRIIDNINLQARPLIKPLPDSYHYVYLYMEWFNNFLTIERFAEYYEISIHRAKVIINKGRVLHQDQFGHH